MIPAGRIDDVSDVETFLAIEKYLSGPPPVWRKPRWGGEYTALWTMTDLAGEELAALKCTAQITNTAVAGLNLIYKSRPIWRVHIDVDSACHDNPHFAERLGIPGKVCGPHEHAWPINRDHILAQDVWELPCRRSLPVKRLGVALAHLADQINLTLTPDQRGFEGPTRSDLFDIGVV